MSFGTARRLVWILAAASYLIATAALAGKGNVTIEKATVPWDELVNLIRDEGHTPPSRLIVAMPDNAPLSYAVPVVEITGDIEGGMARLTLTMSVDVLNDRWTIVPVLPENFAIAKAALTSPHGRRGFLVRNNGVMLAAEGEGRYRAVLTVEGALEQTEAGARLSLPLREIASGSAKLTIAGAEKISGATRWKVRKLAGTMQAEAALGVRGLDLVLGEGGAVKHASAGALEELEAMTVVSLGGSGVGRMRLVATPADGALEVELPPNSRLWRVYVGNAALSVTSLPQKNGVVRIPLSRTSPVEVAWTFDMPPMGIKGRYRVELPKLPTPVRGAKWTVYLPTGLKYSERQAALAPLTSCLGAQGTTAQTPLTPDGDCFAFSRAVLDAGRAWVEGVYEQKL